MSKLNTFKKLWIQDKRQVLVAVYNNIVHTGITNLLSDKTYLKLTYRIRFGEKLDFDNPVTFNQKIQWLKLYDRQERYTGFVDKIKVKDIVANEIGQQYVIPTLGVYDSFDKINFDDLPNQFVLKCNHDSGSIVICKDKSTFDREYARKKLTKGLETDAYYWGREWPYKNVQRKILAEAYMEDDDSEELKDYKLMVFNGKVKCFFVGSERFSKEGLKITFYDTDWKVMPFERHYPKSKLEIKKPLNYDEMVALAEKLAKDIPFARIDFYEVAGKIYFGEITLFPGSGWEEFTPSEWDKTLGSWLKLPRGVLLIKENVVIHFPFQPPQDLTDYKLFCFNGVPKVILVCRNRFSEDGMTEVFFDTEWNHLNVRRPNHGNSKKPIPRPDELNEMLELASALSRNIPFVRVDFYIINHKIYFGELTFYPASGFERFIPESFDYEMGSWLQLPK